MELLLGRPASRLDVFGRRVLLEDGAWLGYDELLIEAARACPAAAIELVGAETGELVDI